MISDKKAIEAAKTLYQYCEEQQVCQNCIFRKFGADHWKCEIQAFELRNILANKKAKSKNHGYI